MSSLSFYWHKLNEESDATSNKNKTKANKQLAQTKRVLEMDYVQDFNRYEKVALFFLFKTFSALFCNTHRRIVKTLIITQA